MVHHSISLDSHKSHQRQSHFEAICGEDATIRRSEEAIRWDKYAIRRGKKGDTVGKSCDTMEERCNILEEKMRYGGQKTAEGVGGWSIEVGNEALDTFPQA